MKHLTFFILTLTAFSCYGQNQTTETQTADFKSVQIGINVSPDICFRTLKNNNGSSTSSTTISLRNESEKIKVGYTVGLNVCFNFNKFIGLETGVQYSNKGYQTKKLDMVFFQPDPSIPNQSKFMYDFHCIDIPIKVNFAVGKKKVRFFSSLGLTTNIFIKENQKSFMYYSDHTDKITSPANYDYNDSNISPTASVGIDYKINNNMNLRIEPTFRYGVLKIINSPVTGYLYNGGLNISYYYGF